jgi:hypothetical protein
MFTYTKLHSPAIECKEGLCISRLVDFELLLELKIEQKKGTSLHTSCCRLSQALNSPVRSVRPSDIFRYPRVFPLGPRLKSSASSPN